MPILVRSMLVCQSVVDLRFFVLVSWSGERPALTLWFSPPRGTEGATRFSLTAHTLPSSTSCLSSVLLGCVVCGDTLVLLWVIGHMIRQDAIDHADGFVTDRDESPLSCSFPRRLVLASLIVGLEMRLMRDQPQGIVIEPVSQVGTAYVRDFRQFSDTRATFEQPDIEACQFNELFAVLIRVNIADGGQDGRCGRLADPGQLHQELVVRAMGKQLDGLGEPQLLFGQSIDQVMC